MERASVLTKVDFEIALTALVATTVAAFPTGEVPEYSVIRVFAVGLLALTLIRRLAVMNALKKDGYVLEITTQLLDLFTYISVLYLLFNISLRIAESPLGFLSPQTLFLIITPVCALGLLLVQQVALNDALRGSEKLFATKSEEHHGEFLGLVLMEVAVFVGKRRQLLHNESRQSRLVEYYPDFIMKDDDSPLQKGIFYAISGTVLLSFILLLGAGSIILDIPLFGAVALLISTMLVIGLVDLWYSLYGVIGAGDRNGNLHFVITATTYLFIGNMIFTI
ncbi:hypothetical protein HALLA_05870 [Halostagnicola larsenii XH-48]|uniref:Uncharacterized protein n=1 Tax=Halostagnicola larsenii XH-48 TaxID=797299 RepID=W0JPT8_9EURY|nr:hypothetical protein [Halostagnicola larsenii]AHG00741.1 hypothetical protein HALLA_05870 [Halostagnicola larsenii XH-48]